MAPDGHARSRPQRRAGVAMAFGAAAVTLLIAITGLWLADHREVIRGTITDASVQLAAAADQQVTHTLQGVELTMRAAVQRHERRLRTGLPPAVADILRDSVEQSPALHDLIVTDENGNWRAGALAARAIDVSAALDSARRAEGSEPLLRLVLVAPTLLEPHSPRSMLAITRWTEGGRSTGWLIGEVPVERFAILFRPLIGTSAFRISLIDRDGLVIAAAPASSAAAAQPIQGWRTLIDATPSTLSEVASGPLAGFTTLRGLSARRLWVATSIDETSAWQGWSDLLASTSAALALLIAGVIAMTAWTMRMLQHRDRAAEALASSRAELLTLEQMLRATFANITEGLAVYDASSALMTWNERFAELMALPPHLLRTGTSAYEITLFQVRRGEFGPVDNPEAVARERVSRAMLVDHYELERPVPKGRTVRIRLKRLPDHSMVGIYVDVTDHKRQERELIEARDLAHAASKSKSRFLANMSHELRTPLNAILGFAEAIRGRLLGPDIDARYVGYADHIHRSGEQLLGLINDLMDLSRIESGRLRLRIETLDSRVVARTLAALAAPLVAPQGQHIMISQPDPPAAFSADAQALEKILICLIANAAKHSSPRAEIRLVFSPRRDGGMEIAVIDKGAGMDAQQVELALTAPNDVLNDYTRQQSGAGIGLQLVKALMTLHGGTLEIESALGLGTTVRMLFPAAIAGEALG